jgi:hypothetical protein
MAGAALGIYLAFFASVTYDLEGIWIGMITGAALGAAVLLVQVFCVDWSYELKKHVYFSTCSHTQTSPGRHTNTSYLDVALAGVDSRALGGFQLRVYRDLDEEIEELTRLEDIAVQTNFAEP